ncbi:MAG TPA: hypothetical protein DCS88_06065 [Alphaproteobacteria bacterium]|nr:hypothetical protein [Alphaproteobacteria bacterium]
MKNQPGQFVEGVMFQTVFLTDGDLITEMFQMADGSITAFVAGIMGLVGIQIFFKIGDDGVDSGAVIGEDDDRQHFAQFRFGAFGPVGG